MLRWIFLLCITLALTSCGSNGDQDLDAGTDAGTDAGRDASTDADTDAGTDADTDAGGDRPAPTGCAFPFAAPPSREMPSGWSVRDKHLLCSLDHDGHLAQVYMEIEAVDETDFGYIVYEARRGWICVDGVVQALDAAGIDYAYGHHGWDVMQLVHEDLRYVYRWSDVCVGYRPCTPSFDVFDVHQQTTGERIAGMLPATCVHLSEQGRPRPLTLNLRQPAGKDNETQFTMGEDDGPADAQPAHLVTLQPFRMDLHEASWADFAMFLDDHGNDCDGTPCIDTEAAGIRVHEQAGRWTADEGAENLPAVHMTWHGAEAFCYWREYMELPSEAQWEFVATAGGMQVFPWGDQTPDCDRAIFADCAQDAQAICSVTPTGVDGFCDLAGNVAEWIGDWYDADFYASCTTDCFNPRGPETDTGTKVLRGGSYADDGASMASRLRGTQAPATSSAQVGLRCVRRQFTRSQYDPPEP